MDDMRETETDDMREKVFHIVFRDKFERIERVFVMDFTDLNETGWEPWMTAEKDRHRHHRHWERYEQVRGKRRKKISNMGKGKRHVNQ